MTDLHRCIKSLSFLRASRKRASLQAALLPVHHALDSSCQPHKTLSFSLDRLTGVRSVDGSTTAYAGVYSIRLGP